MARERRGAPSRPAACDAEAVVRRSRGAEAAAAGVPPLLLVDAANVIAVIPDGWWRRRAEATELLRDALEPLAETGLSAPGLPAWLTRPPLDVVLVVEGVAARVAGSPNVRVIAARGSGDDAIVGLVAADVGRRSAVVTADRALRWRVIELGAIAVSPWALPRRPRLPVRRARRRGRRPG